MVEKVFIKVAANVAANIVLFVIYAHYFGRLSIQKYEEAGVTIVKSKVESSSIVPPGRYLFTRSIEE